MPLDVLRKRNAWRLDHVDDVAANGWPDLARISYEFPADVAGNDGGDDTALCAADVHQNTVPVPLSFCMASGYFAIWLAAGVGVYVFGVAFAAMAMSSDSFSRAVPVLSGGSLLVA